MYVRTLDPHWTPGACSISAGQDAGAGGAGGDQGGAGGAASGREAGASQANGTSTSQASEPLTLDALKSLLTERDAQFEKRFKKLNDELASRRHGPQTGRTEGGDEPRTKPSNGDSGVTREDLTAYRAFDRTMAVLESNLEPEAIREIQERTQDLSPAAGAAFVEAIRMGLELGRRSANGSVTGDREVGTGNGKQQPRRPQGRAEGPATRSSGVKLPDSWAEYVSLAKTDPERKAALDRLPLEQFDPVALREKGGPAAPLVRRGALDRKA